MAVVRVSGDACVALGRRFCVLQRQRGASPAANQDAGSISGQFLTEMQLAHSEDSGYKAQFGKSEKKPPASR